MAETAAAVQAADAQTPTAGVGVTATLATVTHGGKFYLTIGGCLAYHYYLNTGATDHGAVGPTWPLFKHDGAPHTQVPGCV